jgi:signal transduction histidine kinase
MEAGQTLGRDDPANRPAPLAPAPILDLERYHLLFTLIDEGFCIVKVIFTDDGKAYDYRFLEVNPAFERHTGLHNAAGKTARDLVPDLEDHWFEIYGGVARTGESVRFTNHASALEDRWFDVNAFRIGAPELCLVGILFIDVTQRKRLEQLQRDFIAMTNHDLSAPISVVRARAQLMRRRETFDPDGLDVIIEQTRRMERLLTDLREAIKAGAGWVEILPAQIDLCQIARDAAERARTLSKRHPIAVSVPDAPVIGNWDQDRLSQILDNLIGNAQKYSGSGGAITVSVRVDGGSARLTVADTGPGISQDELPHLFERFYRGDRTSATSGLGLGLYIVRMLIEAHGGRVWAESEPGEGTRIQVELPLAVRFQHGEDAEQ